jgi:hypothetical protein
MRGDTANFAANFLAGAAPIQCDFLEQAFVALGLLSRILTRRGAIRPPKRGMALLIVLGGLAIHADGEAYGDEDPPARIDQPEPRHEFLLSGDLVVDMRGAVDQVGSGILKAAIRKFELIVRRQPALLPEHLRQKQR